jgi:RNA polymerase sigma factor (sigma-70 family)
MVALSSADEVVTTLVPLLYRLAYALTGNRDDADDLIQAASLRLLRHWRRVAEADDSLRYAKQLVINEHASQHRRLMRHIRLTRRLLQYNVAQLDENVPRSQIDLWASLSRLTRPQRSVLVLQFYEGLPNDEVARLLNIPPATVRSHARRGLQRLRKELEDAGEW